MGELRTDLEEDGQYTPQEIEVIVNKYKNRFRSIHHRNYKTQVNRVLGLNDNVVGEIRQVLKELLKFYRTAFRFNIAFGKLLHSRKDNRAKYYHASMHGRGVLFNTAPKIASSTDINRALNRIVRQDLDADLIQPRENSEYKGVMYTNFSLYHVPVMVRNDIKGVRRSIKRCCHEFPLWKVRDNTIISHFSRGNQDVHYRDGLCMFRALAIYRMGITEIRDLECDDDFDDLVETLLGTYVEFKQQLVVDEAFLGVGFPARELEILDIREHGVSESEISLIEKCFDINIVLLTKGEDGQAFIYRESCYRHDENSERVVYLDIYEDHVSYILNVDGYSGVYCCQNCGRHFGQMGHLKRHKRMTRDCSKFPVERFPGGFFKRRLSIFEEICMLPIENIDQYAADKYYPYLICFDFEAMHEKTDDFDIVDTEIEVEVNDSQAKGKTRFISLHSLISVSVCSNVPGFTEPYHIVKSVSEKRLVVDMIEYMMKIQQSVRLILLRECKNLFEKLNLYLRLLIDKVKTTAEEKTTHVWKDDRLREVEMYLQNFNTPIARTSTRTTTRPAASTSTCTVRRTPVNASHRRRYNTTNVFVNDEATVDGGVIVSDDEEQDSSNVFFQTDLDFIDDRSVESSSLNSLIGQSDQQVSQAALSSSLTENCQNFEDEPEYGQTNDDDDDDDDDDDNNDDDDDDPDIDVGVRAVRDRLSRRIPAKNLRKPVLSSVDKEVKK